MSAEYFIGQGMEIEAHVAGDEPQRPSAGRANDVLQLALLHCVGDRHRVVGDAGAERHGQRVLRVEVDCQDGLAFLARLTAKLVAVTVLPTPLFWLVLMTTAMKILLPGAQPGTVPVLRLVIADRLPAKRRSLGGVRSVSCWQIADGFPASRQSFTTHDPASCRIFPGL
jgi:hypothetical protein